MHRSYEDEFSRIAGGFAASRSLDDWRALSNDAAVTSGDAGPRLPLPMWRASAAIAAAIVATLVVALVYRPGGLTSAAHRPQATHIHNVPVVVQPPLARSAVKQQSVAPTPAPTAVTTPAVNHHAPPAIPPPIQIPPPATTQPPSSPNLLQNPSFESALSPWNLAVTSPAVATQNQDASTAYDGTYSDAVSVTTASSPTNNWYVQLDQRGFALKANTTYTLSFWAKASASERIDFCLQTPDGTSIFINEWNTNLTGSWQHFTATYTTGAAVPEGMVAFNLGAGAAMYWIDMVSLTAS